MDYGKCKDGSWRSKILRVITLKTVMIYLIHTINALYML